MNEGAPLSQAPLTWMSEVNVSSEAELREFLDRVSCELNDSPFDLEKGRLYRLCAAYTGAQTTLIVLHAHPLVFDQHSANPFAEALFAGLPELGGTAAVPFTLARPQADPAVDCRRAWSSYLADLPSGMELPPDYSRTEQDGHASRRIPIELDAQLESKLGSFSNREDMSPEVILRSAWCILFHRLYRANECVIGLTSRRNAPGIGQFSDLIPARVSVDGSKSVRENLVHLGEMQRALETLPAIAFQTLLEIVKPPRSPGRHPMFDCLFHVHLEGEPRASGPAARELLMDPGRGDFDVSVVLRRDPSGALIGFVEYRTALYAAETAASWARRWVLLLERMLEHPDEILDEVDILHPGEEAEIVAMCQGDVRDIDPALRLHDFLSRQAAKRPDAPAILCDDRIVSYSEADRRTANLAGALSAAGVGPGTIVGVMVRRSEWLSIALFGVLKADGAYLPIDPDFPPERIRFLLQDSGVNHLIVGPGVSVPDGFEGASYSLPGKAPDQAPPLLPNRSSGSDPAYVIYTSGSTGQPKGTIVLHSSIVNQLMWMQDYFRFESTDVFLQSTACTFDVSLFELFVWSIAGGKVVMPPPLAERDPRILTGLVTRYQITHLHFVPSMMSAFFAFLRSSTACSQFSGLTSVICSGEALSVQLVKEFRGTLGIPFGIRLYNLYGPTEAAVHASYFDCCGLEKHVLVPIGKPVWNTSLYIVDKCGKLLPRGAIGELYIGGVQVADGYLNRDELTKERFISDPYGGCSEARLYKTGDLTRYLHDGNVQYLGRNDFQIKIRGVRVEPGEIEKALTDIAGVAESVVVALPGPNGDVRLAAYVTGERDRLLPEASMLLEALRNRLPSHFVPAAITVMSELPLNASGKLDRKRLPAPVFQDSRTRGAGVDRREDPLSELAGAIWSDVMRTGPPGPNSNFFDEGGHSLLAIRLLARLEEATGREIPLSAFFENPTLQGLCERLQVDRPNATAKISPFPSTSRQVLPLTWGQRRMLVLNRLDANGTGFNIVFAAGLKGGLDRERLRSALLRVFDSHEALRLHFPERDGNWMAVLLSEDEIAETVLHWTECDDSNIEDCRPAVLEALWNRRMDLSTGPLCELHVYRFAGDEHLLAFLLHHSISDETAEDIIWNDLAAAYNGLEKGDAGALIKPALQAGDVSMWEQDPARESSYRQEIVAWRSLLEDAPTLLDLPFDMPVPEAPSFVGDRQHVDLGPELSERLDRYLRSSSVTPFMGFLSAWGAFLSRLCHQDDLLIGIPVSMRRLPGLERTIGFLLNTVPLRIHSKFDASFEQGLGFVRDVCLQAYDLANLPFDQLVANVPHVRHSGRSPLVQTMLVMATERTEPPEFENIRSRLIETRPKTSKFDLTLFVTRREEGYHLELEYRSDLFLEETIRSWLADFAAFVGNLTDNPTKPVGEISCVSEGQLHAQKVCSTSGMLRTQERSLVELLMKSFSQHPDRVALSDGTTELTYRELEQSAATVAGELASVAERNSPCIGVCGSRSTELISHILAILMSGHGYVPLDPTWPLERLAFVMQDAPMGVILAVSEEDASAIQAALETLPADVVRPRLVRAVELTHGRTSGRPNWAVDVRNPEDLAYVIYTSGSTGRPKGVMIEQGNVLASTASRIEYYKTPVEKFMLLSPAIFDSSVAGIFWTLATGGCLVLPPKDMERDPALLARWIVEQKVTTFLCLPSLHEHLLGWLAGLESRLQSVIVAGENCPVSLTALHTKVLPTVDLFNEYGPTEGTVWATVARLSGTTSSARVSIGKPIPGAEVHVVSGTLRYFPRGAAGELVIGGPGVARGYCRQDALTATHFIVGPSGDLPEGRFYKTGDLVRWNSMGELEFLGRLDSQVKIRGFRIEPGEIEECLKTIPGVLDVVVIPAMDDGRDLRLEAWVQVSEHGLDETAVKQKLRASLPAYMVPSRIQMISASFPRTATGKIDRDRLRSAFPERALVTSGSTKIQHEDLSATEQTLLEIWQTVLARKDFGVEADFFDLGGHSYLAIRLFSIIEKRFGTAFSVAVLYKAPTVRMLARLVDRADQDGNSKSCTISIKTGTGSHRLFCIHPRDGGVLIYRELGQSIDDRISVTGIEAPWFRSVSDESSSIEETASRYMEEVLRAAEVGEVLHLCGFSVGGLIALELGRLLKSAGYRVGMVCLLDTYNPGSPPTRIAFSKRWARRLLPEDVKSVPQFFRNAGYAVARTVKAVSLGYREKIALKRLARASNRGKVLPMEMRLLAARSRIVQACDNFRPKPIDVKILLVRAEDMDDGHTRSRDLGWGEVARAGLEIFEVEGDHTTFMESPHVLGISAYLSEVILREDS